MTCSVSHFAFRAKQRKLLVDEIAKKKKGLLAFKVPRLHLKNFFLHRHRGLLSFSTVESHGLPSAFIRLPGNNIIEHIQERGNRGGDLENTVLRLEVLYELASVNRHISLETVDLII